MKQKLTMRTVFWSSTVFLFLLNIIGVITFKKSFKLSPNTLVASLFFALLLIRGVLACTSKDEMLLFLDKSHYHSKFYRYNQPTNKQLNDFYFKAAIYFAAIPFYLPIAVFTEKITQLLWCLLLLLAPQLALIGIEIRKMMLEQKEQKIKEALLEKEKKEQEKREEMGYWK